VDVKDATAARLGIEAVGEEGLDSRRLVEKRERLHRGGNVVREAGGILLGLHLHARERRAGLLGLDHADSLPVDIEQVVGEPVAGAQRKLANGHPARGVEVHGRAILGGPA